MKKTILILSLAAILGSQALHVPRKAHAADFGAGASMLYTGWVPAVRDELNIDTIPLFMFGPVLSVSFLNGWGFSLVGLQNIFMRTDVSYEWEGVGEAGPYTVYKESAVLRIDIDGVLSYGVLDWLKVFAGYKLFHYASDSAGGEEDGVTPPYTEVDAENGEYKFENLSHGPALGFALSFAIIGNLSFMYNSSLVYMKSDYQLTVYAGSNPTMIMLRLSQPRYYMFGTNNVLSLAYYVDALNCSLSLGGRLQVFKYYEIDDAPVLEVEYFYGMTASVLFTF